MKLIVEQTELFPHYNLENISPLGEMLLFDIETTGLKKETTQIYLIGCGYFNERGAFEVRQWLADSAHDEREVLEQFVEFAGRFTTLVHFNGDGFDIPYVAYKADYYGMNFSFDRFKSVDIYKRIKGFKKFFGLERMNQTTVEQFLKISRTDKMNGGLLIPVYYEYEKTADEECERLLLLHNSDDVKGMIQLVEALSYADIFDGRFSFRSCESVGNTLVLEYILANAVPVPVNTDNGQVSVYAENNLLQININVFEGTAGIPVKNVEDYYYLPAEDKIIHKDVAMFVDKKFRKKATAQNCFIKKSGRFVPACGLESEIPDDSLLSKSVFMVRGEKNHLMPFIEEQSVLEMDAEQSENYALKVLYGIMTKK